MKKWYKWPENYIGNAAPWYTILRRVVFLPFVVFFFIFTYIFIALGWGLDQAERFKKEIF